MDSKTLVKDLASALLPELQQQIGRQYGVGYKHDSPGNPITVGYVHGPGGLLTFPGVDNAIFHTVMGNRSIIGQLPATPSMFAQPTYYTITGVQGDSGSEAAENCDPSPTAGLKKACLTVSVFGRYKRQTPEMELNRLGLRNDRADPMDLTLVGSPIHGSGLFTTGIANPATPGDLLINEVSQKFWELAVSVHRLLSIEIWQGNPANDAGELGSRRQMTGLATLVNTGYVDAETNQSCPSMDSYVRNFSYGRVDTAAAADNIIAAITDMYYQVRDRAVRTGVMPVRWAFAMRPQLFYELTAIWPCSYLSFRCITGNPNATEFIDAQDAVRFRDEMRAGSYLLIDGERVPVLQDDGIPEATNTTNANVPSGCFGTDIYLLPFSVVGGRSVLFMEYMQYQNPALQDALGNMVLGRVDGAFLIVPVQTRQCFQFEVKVEPRMVLRTPWLAARLQNVVYCPIQHLRDTFPADPYHVDGGRTTRAGPSFYTLWGEGTGAP